MSSGFDFLPETIKQKLALEEIRSADDLPAYDDKVAWSLLKESATLKIPEIKIIRTTVILSSSQTAAPASTTLVPQAIFAALGVINVTRVRLVISSAKASRGVRSTVFHYGIGAYYNDETGTHESSIYYIENDLHVNLLFGSAESANSFVCKIEKELTYYKLPEECKIINEVFENLHVNRAVLRRLKQTDYVRSQMGSPFCESVTTSSSSSQNSDYVKMRDKYTCLACGLSYAQSKDKSHLLEAGHILDVEEETAARDAGDDALSQLLEEVGIVSAEHDVNVISLCHQCHHDYFKMHKICIDYDEPTQRYFWVVKDSAVGDSMPGQQGTYKEIIGKEIKYPPTYRPPPQLIQHRMKEFLRSGNNGNNKKRKMSE